MVLAYFMTTSNELNTLAVSTDSFDSRVSVSRQYGLNLVFGFVEIDIYISAADVRRR